MSTTESPRSLGARLKAARLQKNVSLSEAAEATRIKKTQLEMIEADQFDRFAAPIYVKGFLRIYSEYLGLDPEQVVAEYVRMYGAARPHLTHEVAPKIIRRPAAPSPELAPTTELGGGAGEEPAPTEVTPVWQRWLARALSPPVRRAAGGVLLAVATVVGLAWAAHALVQWSKRVLGRPMTAVSDYLQEPPDPYLDPQRIRTVTSAPRPP